MACAQRWRPVPGWRGEGWQHPVLFFVRPLASAAHAETSAKASSAGELRAAADVIPGKVHSRRWPQTLTPRSVGHWPQPGGKSSLCSASRSTAWAFSGGKWRWRRRSSARPQASVRCRTRMWLVPWPNAFGSHARGCLSGWCSAQAPSAKAIVDMNRKSKAVGFCPAHARQQRRKSPCHPTHAHLGEVGTTHNLGQEPGSTARDCWAFVVFAAASVSVLVLCRLLSR